MITRHKGLNKIKGKHGEAQACTYLRSLGYKIIDTNWCCRLGEIDIIAEDGDCLVFVEVKWRYADPLGNPEASVGYTKQKQLQRLAKIYLDRKVGHETLARFDVIVIVGNTLEHYRNAFW